MAAQIQRQPNVLSTPTLTDSTSTGVVTIVDLVHVQSKTVLIHCSDGWDRTPQLTATSMLCLDPYYRTLEGFEVLIEKVPALTCLYVTLVTIVATVTYLLSRLNNNRSGVLLGINLPKERERNYIPKQTAKSAHQYFYNGLTSFINSYVRCVSCTKKATPLTPSSLLHLNLTIASWLLL